MSKASRFQGDKPVAVPRRNGTVRGRRSSAGRRTTLHHRASPVSVIRRRSRTRLFGLPLWEIASGPDAKHGEEHGHARAIFAIGDVADGVFALGGVARGGVTIGGVSLGALSLGGVAISLIGAVGGVAIAPLAYGGVALGCVAVGGAAVGIYAKGDSAMGRHVVQNRHTMRTIRKLLHGHRP